MDIPKNQESEQSPEKLVVGSIKRMHEDFLNAVPKYSKTRWRPSEALRLKEGSCMAELLYVAGGLLAKKEVEEADVTVGFSKTHGKEQPKGFVGSGKKYAHAFMLITTKQGTTLECDFRANRADEEPRVQRLLSDEIDVVTTHILPLAQAIEAYGAVDAEQNPSVEDLIRIHTGDTDPAPVRFDQDF